MKIVTHLFLVLGVLLFISSSRAAVIDDENPLYLPSIGDHELRIISTNILELALITTKAPDPAPLTNWNFVSKDGVLKLPETNEFKVLVNNREVPIQELGLKRRVAYAPLRTRDLRIGNYIYIQLATAVPEEAKVEVKNPQCSLWPKETVFEARATKLRYSPAIHINQVGYMPDFPKKAMVGYYLGSLGEMSVVTNSPFYLVDAHSDSKVFEGTLISRPDIGYTYKPSPYQKVLEADFTRFKTPGEYKLVVPGLGSSYPFFIDEGIAAAFSRTYALGLYHQRCGTNNALPYTRFVHGPCHLPPAKVPTMSSDFDFVNSALAGESANYKSNPKHTAPQLKNVAASLYPFVNREPVDVSGGHHDAGDYSKYTINSAMLIHYLVFAADAFPGVGALDNLGLPESGDDKSDLLQEAKWEADFLAKMQDADGGFYFLVYPLTRPYEDNVLPDHGDRQVVFPKTTSMTAVAVAALAEAGSSPLFKKQFPEASALYLEKAKKGWAFLERAITKYGMDGAYQKITHGGDTFMHNDELAWAATELFLATGETNYHQKLKEWLDPADPQIRRWGWMRLPDSYGCAIRSYAFGAATGRVSTNQIDTYFLNKCKAEIRAAGMDQFRYARDCAYGSSFPSASKNYRVAGWYFSGEQAFDLAVARQLDWPILNDQRTNLLEAIISNMNFEGGCNPVNVTYLTGLGWKRQREIVHHYAQNDHRILPPSGIPLGNIEEGFYWMDKYKSELGALTFPLDGGSTAPYPFYDRWGDSFNVNTEFVAATAARSFVTYASVMAMTSIRTQTWNSAVGKINITTEKASKQPTASASADKMELDKARIVWEARDQQPTYGKTFSFTPKTPGTQWVEFEAQWPDGRRVSAATNFTSDATLLK